MTSLHLQVSEEYAGRLAYQNEELLRHIASKTSTQLYMSPKLDGNNFVCIEGSISDVKEAKSSLLKLSNKPVLSPESCSLIFTRNSYPSCDRRLSDNQVDHCSYERGEENITTKSQTNQQPINHNIKHQRESKVDNKMCSSLDELTNTSLSDCEFDKDIYNLGKSFGKVCMLHTFVSTPHNTGACRRVHLRHGHCYSDEAKFAITSNLLYSSNKVVHHLCPVKCAKWNVQFHMLPKAVQLENPKLDSSLLKMKLNSNLKPVLTTTKRGTSSAQEEGTCILGDNSKFEEKGFGDDLKRKFNFLDDSQADHYHEESYKEGYQEEDYDERYFDEEDVNFSYKKELEGEEKTTDQQDMIMRKRFKVDHDVVDHTKYLSTNDTRNFCITHLFLKGTSHDAQNCPFVHLKKSFHYSKEFQQFVAKKCLSNYCHAKQLCPSKCFNWNVDISFLSPQLMKKNSKLEAIMMRIAASKPKSLVRQDKSDNRSFIERKNTETAGPLLQNSVSRLDTSGKLSSKDFSSPSNSQESCFDQELFRLKNTDYICFNHTFGDAPDHNTEKCPRLHLRSAKYYSDKTKKWVAEGCLSKRKKSDRLLSFSKCRDWKVDIAMLSPQLKESNPHVIQALMPTLTVDTRNNQHLHTFPAVIETPSQVQTYKSPVLSLDIKKEVKDGCMPLALNDMKIQALVRNISIKREIDDEYDDTYDNEIYSIAHMNAVCFNHTFLRSKKSENHGPSKCSRYHLRKGNFYSNEAKQYLLEGCLYKTGRGCSSRIPKGAKLCPLKCNAWNLDVEKLPLKLKRANPKLKASMHNACKEEKQATVVTSKRLRALDTANQSHSLSFPARLNSMSESTRQNEFDNEVKICSTSTPFYDHSKPSSAINHTDEIAEASYQPSLPMTLTLPPSQPSSQPLLLPHIIPPPFPPQLSSSYLPPPPPPPPSPSSSYLPPPPPPPPSPSSSYLPPPPPQLSSSYLPPSPPPPPSPSWSYVPSSPLFPSSPPPQLSSSYLPPPPPSPSSLSSYVSPPPPFPSSRPPLLSSSYTPPLSSSSSNSSSSMSFHTIPPPFLSEESAVVSRRARSPTPEYD